MYIIYFFDKNFNDVASVRVKNNSLGNIDAAKKDIEKRFFNGQETKILVVNSENNIQALLAYKNSIASQQKQRVEELFKKGDKFFENYNKRYSNVKFYFFDDRGVFCKIMKNGKKLRVFNTAEYLNTINF